jgi:hypothetical protein
LLLAGLAGNWLLDPFGRRLQASDRDDYARAEPTSTALGRSTPVAAPDPAK